jgi:hypothetical protein
VSSRQVHSLTPEDDVREGEIAHSDAPVWILGGGKTAMDTARAVITGFPGREVNMLAGSGTYFINRDRSFPSGHRRWWAGKRGYLTFRDLAMRFDGNNQHEVMGWFRDSGICLSVTPQAKHFLFGQLSPREARTIKDGLNHLVMDHLVDVVDSDDRVEMRMRSGSVRAIEPGSWLVNCSGHFFHRDPVPYSPYTSGDGRVASVSPRSTIALLASFNGYFLSHLLMLDKLDEVPLYALDGDQLARQDRDAWACALVALHLHNLAVMLDEVPREVFAGNGLDFERWFPPARQLLTNVQFAREHQRVREHTAASLDRVRDVHQVRCGPLNAPALSAPG